LKKLLIALAALALPTAAMAQHHHGNHYGYHHHHRNGTIRFGIFVNPPRYYNYGSGYYGPTWPAGEFVGCTQYGRNGLLVTNYGRLVRNYEPFIRNIVHCDTRY